MSKIIVVIATYNEAETIDRILHGLLSGQPDTHVIVVDDSSPDGTGDKARHWPGVTVVTRPEKSGIASAYLLGLSLALESGADWIVQMDAGGTHDPLAVPRMVHVGQQFGSNLVLSSRFMQTVPRDSYRTWISLGAAWLMRRRGVGVTDATSGFRAWRRDLLAKLDLESVRSRGFAFQIELLWQAYQHHACWCVMSIPYCRTNSSFKWAMVWEALRIYWGLS